MVNTILASLALAGSAVASSVGSAFVVNKCDYEVTLCNVPASGGGYDQQDKTLAAGESWTQAWTELSNGNGWSIKLSKSASLENILQYEYTFHNDGIIWYDLSCVNGNPWDKDWEITASGADCSPKQQAYRYATDDAYGMQSCASSADITVTLCTGVSADNGNSTDAGSGSASASAPSYESTSASAPSYSSSTSAPAPVAYTASSSSSVEPLGYGPSGWTHGYQAQTTPTTLATSASLTTEVETYAGGAITITEVETAYVTAVVTAYEKRGAPAPNRFRRHEHHAHAHQHEQ